MLKIQTISILSVFLLAGCSLWGEMPSQTQPFNAKDLSEIHHYKIPPQTKTASRFNVFKDSQLEQLLSVALQDSPDLHSAEVRVLQAEALAKEAKAALFPSVDFNGYLQRQHFPLLGLVPPPFNGKTFNIANLGLNINDEIDVWGKQREMLKSRLSESFAAKADLAEAHLIISAAVASLYFELIGARTQRELAEENVRLQEKLTSILSGRTKQGIESDIPLNTVQANTQIARLAVEAYKQAEHQTRHQLAVVMGKNPFTTDIEIHPMLSRKKSVRLPAVISANLLANRPDIASARALAEAAAHQVNVAKASFFPNINLNGLVGLQSVLLSQFFSSKSQNEAIGGAFDLPIFDLGVRRANLRIKQGDYELAITHYNQTILNALKEVADKLTELQTLKNKLLSQTKAVNETRHNYELTKSRYRQGIVDYVSVIEIKQLLLQQTSEQRQLQTQQQQAIVALLKALGGEV